jgi:hypothetical protein
MTTFTSDDREEAYKKILEEAPNQPGYEDAVPIDVKINASPPHVVDSGASVMSIKPVAWINEYDQLEPFNPDNRQDWIPVYTQSVKELTDEEIGWFAKAYTDRNDKLNIVDFARAILRKAQEK